MVKGTQFNSWRSVGNVAQAIRVHAARGCDELVLLDIGATPENRGPDLALIEELAGVMTTPLAVGGGIRSLRDIDALLRSGADKVIINTALFEVPRLLEEASKHFGAQAVVAAMDVKQDNLVYRCGSIFSEGDMSVLWDVINDRAGEVLLTSVEREGMLAGYDLELIDRVAAAVQIPVIAHGGCGTPEHMLEAVQAGADAVAAGAMFAFTDHTPASCAEYLAAKGVEVRRKAA